MHRPLSRRTRTGLATVLIVAAAAAGPSTLGSVGARAATSPRSAAGSAGSVAVQQVAAWPTPSASVKLTATQKVSGTFDGGNKRYYGLGDGGQGESQPALFEVANGGTIRNVIIGAPAGDGIHCKGSCTIQNVWWEDVGEDAATFEGADAGTRVNISGGGAKKASDKIFQHNGGGTVSISGFYTEDFGKLYRACGNCKQHYQRNVMLANITAKAPGKVLVGINTNWGDTAKFSNITIQGDSSKKIKICAKFQGVAKGSEPKEIGSGPDGKNCIYSTGDIRYS